MRRMFSESKIRNIAKEAIGEVVGYYGHYVHFTYADSGQEYEYKIEFYDNYDGRYEITDLENILSIAKAGTYTIDLDSEIGSTLLVTVPTGIACVNFLQSGSEWTPTYKLLNLEEITNFVDEEI